MREAGIAARIMSTSERRLALRVRLRWPTSARAGPSRSVRRVGAKDAGPAAPAEIKFLQGPRPRGSSSGSAVRIFRELVYGFRKLHFVGPCVTVFGSARFDEHHRYYAMAREVGQLAGRSPGSP